MNSEKIVRTTDISEAYSTYISDEHAVLMAGGVFLKLQKRSVPVIVDLSLLALDYIDVKHDAIYIGAMATLRDIETNEHVPTAVRQSVEQVAGVGLRNLATVGGSVCGQYPFSDITTALLALDAQLKFHNEGIISLEAYLKNHVPKRDILLEVILPMGVDSCFKCFKQVYTDFSLINVAVASDGNWRIAIGARPGGPVLITAQSLKDHQLESLIDTIAFGSDSRASDEYRKSLATLFIKEAIEEVASWK